MARVGARKLVKDEELSPPDGRAERECNCERDPTPGKCPSRNHGNSSSRVKAAQIEPPLPRRHQQGGENWRERGLDLVKSTDRRNQGEEFFVAGPQAQPVDEIFNLVCWAVV